MSGQVEMGERKKKKYISKVYDLHSCLCVFCAWSACNTGSAFGTIPAGGLSACAAAALAAPAPNPQLAGHCSPYGEGMGILLRPPHNAAGSCILLLFLLINFI